MKKTVSLLHGRVPVRLLSIRAPRQVVLRTSSWLAPSFATTRSCDLPVKKTRDTSNRHLPPIRTACTHTSRVPGSLSLLSQRGGPMETKAPRDDNRGTERFHDVRKTASADRHLTRVTSTLILASRPGAPNVGVFFPRHRCDRASDTPVAILDFLTVDSPSRDSSENSKTAETTADTDS